MSSWFELKRTLFRSAESETYSTSNGTGRQERGRRAAGGGNRVEVRPAVALPREDEAVAVGPEDLILRHDVAIDAAAPLLRPEDFARRPRRGVGDAQRPGLRFPVRAEGLDLLRGGEPQEGEALSVGRPDGSRVAVDARVQVADGLARRLVDADEAVVAAPAGEGEAGPVRRPAQGRVVAPALEELRRLRFPRAARTRPAPSGRRRRCPSERWRARGRRRSGAALPPAVGATKTACSAPSALLPGLGISPRRFAPPPRTKTMFLPSAENARSEISCPSSARNDVNRLPL